MKFTKILYRQHIDRMFKFHWRVQGKRVPIETKAEQFLISKGIPLYDPKELVNEKREKIWVDVIGFVPKKVRFDESHPNWHNTVCYFNRDTNVLLEGMNQAKIITKTVEIKEGLPEKIQIANKLNKEIKTKILNIILSSQLYDTEQKKLPKAIDPFRPQINLPRVLGITYERRMSLLTTKLLQLIENISDKNLVKQRIVTNNAKFFVPLRKEEDLLQLELSANKILLSKTPLDNLTQESGENFELPNLFPIKHTITMKPENIYETKNIYPLKQPSIYHPHTIFVHYDSTKVKNLFEEEVTETQILGQSLMKTFAVAASYARQKFGDDVKDLPKPVTLQCVQTDGRLFHFAMLQLNTLDLTNEGVKNIWYSIPRIPLFQSCQYNQGVPTVEGYNSDVVKYLLAFYNNV